MRVRFWGTRGSIAAPGPETLRYGGNTSCVELRADDGTLIILDCGTGARKLGLALAARKEPIRAHLLIGHTHADHIQGLPFFVPAFLPGSQLDIYGPAGIDRSFPSAIGGQMEYAYFPVPIKDLPSEMRFHELAETTFSIGAVTITTRFLNHTAPTIGYRIEAGGVTVVYATDHEPHAVPYWQAGRSDGVYDVSALLHPGDAAHVEFLREADLVIHDAQYLAHEYPQKVGWGHSTLEYVVDMARTGHVRCLALFHHDPMRDDDAMDTLLRDAKAGVYSAVPALEIRAAAEGDEVELEERRMIPLPVGEAQDATVPESARVLVADDDDLVADALQDVLEGDGYEVSRAVTGDEAVEVALAGNFDLILLDVNMPGMNGHDACRQLRADPRLKTVPIVMLTGATRPEDVQAGFEDGVTDYMTKPFSVAQLRARVRSWLTRVPVAEA